jgi:hypothetical protein
MFTEMRAAFSLQRAFAQNRRYAGDEHAPAPVTVQDNPQSRDERRGPAAPGWMTVSAPSHRANKRT